MNWRERRLVKKSRDRGKISHIAGEVTKSDGNKILGKWKEERLGDMKQEERVEELEKRYT